MDFVLLQQIFLLVMASIVLSHASKSDLMHVTFHIIVDIKICIIIHDILN